MAVSAKDLEEQLRAVGKKLSSLPSAPDELLKILYRTESLLLKVEQSPSSTMLDSLRPTIKALIHKELKVCSDEDMKVVVLSCISELIRITAPDGPYDDDAMKDVFQRIVEIFERLDDMKSPSFSRRIAILETFAKIKACVMMLDLECDDLILEMFGYFTCKIRPTHAYSVFSSMETIMTIVLRESEEISPDLISCLLDTVTLENKNILPVARELGDKVIRNCENELKPYIKEFFKSKFASLRKYNPIVRNICKKKTVASELNGTNVSGETMRDDSRPSDRTESDNLPEEYVKLDGKARCQEVVFGTVERSTKPSMGNASTQVVDAESSRSSVKVKSSGREKLKITSKAETGSYIISTVCDVGTPDTSQAKISKLLASCPKEPLDNGDFEVKSQSLTSKRGPADKVRWKKRKSGIIFGEELSSEEDILLPKSAKSSPKDESNSERTPITAGTKQDLVVKEISDKPYTQNKLDDSLVGAQVKIWWPCDGRYYAGVIKSYDPRTKKHRILYNDGDVEILLLSEERWLLVDEVGKGDLGSMNGMASLDTTPKGPRPKKVKVMSSSLLRASNEESPLKSDKGTGSTGRCLLIRKGRLHEVDSIHDHSQERETRPCDKSSEFGRELKMAATSKLKDGTPKADKLIVKIVNDSKGNSSKPAKKPYGETLKAADDNNREIDNTAIKGITGMLKAKLSEDDSSAPVGNSNVTNIPKPVSELKVNSAIGKFKIRVHEPTLSSQFQPDTRKTDFRGEKIMKAG